MKLSGEREHEAVILHALTLIHVHGADFHYHCSKLLLLDFLPAGLCNCRHADALSHLQHI
jgi:hypothetical protein